jgi:hypothetical protein
LEIHTDVAGSDIAFGCGKSDSLTETMRIRGNGNLSEIQRLTVANQAALQQLKELQEVKQKLGLLEATVNKFLASGG